MMTEKEMAAVVEVLGIAIDAMDSQDSACQYLCGFLAGMTLAASNA